ncbi:MAG: apolipoprotein N-acyltransferase [Bacteroidales bacterium]|jgi:apolipoprotein N-acyltransferase|nr:apolipoprotein N-acyltransferase [Bacteroidales bacterium]
MKNTTLNNFILSISSGLILCLGWTQLGLGWTSFIAFVPLLIIMERLIKSEKKNGGSQFFGYTYLTFIIWNALSTWWIYYATLPGAIAAIVLSSLFMAIVMRVSYSSFKAFGRRIGYIVFATNWVAFEYLFMNSDISWPWLVLGNSFSNNISLIQWYEYTGHFGGSVWIVVINLFIYEILRQLTEKKEKKKIRNYSIGLACLIFIPMIFSGIRYSTYSDIGKNVDIVIVQPNIDPYNDKFGNLTTDEQLDIILNTAGTLADENVNYFVAPETAIPNGMWENEIETESSIIYIRSFLSQYFPHAKFIIGASTRKLYLDGENKSITARKFKSSEHYYDIFNTSVQIDTSPDIYIYHKSKLVPGVEMMPYPQVFGFLQEILFDLGGMVGSHGTQEKRSVFPNEELGINVGVPICYESAYGEFMGEFVQEGANLLFVITNDGWWDDTPGYKQHRSFSRIRAVETRKSIARSANTGISCFINQRGDIIQELGWWKRGALRDTIKANDIETFYTKYGDYIARMCIAISLVVIAVQIVNMVLRRLKKS